jgi:hypothetical protein
MTRLLQTLPALVSWPLAMQRDKTGSPVTAARTFNPVLA